MTRAGRVTSSLLGLVLLVGACGEEPWQALREPIDYHEQRYVFPARANDRIDLVLIVDRSTAAAGCPAGLLRFGRELVGLLKQHDRWQLPLDFRILVRAADGADPAPPPVIANDPLTARPDAEVIAALDRALLARFDGAPEAQAPLAALERALSGDVPRRGAYLGIFLLAATPDRSPGTVGHYVRWLALDVPGPERTFIGALLPAAGDPRLQTVLEAFPSARDGEPLAAPFCGDPVPLLQPLRPAIYDFATHCLVVPHFGGPEEVCVLDEIDPDDPRYYLRAAIPPASGWDLLTGSPACGWLEPLEGVVAELRLQPRLQYTFGYTSLVALTCLLPTRDPTP